MTGIYIHIPFCLRKCPYCDFYSLRYEQNVADEYLLALSRSFAMPQYKGIQADTVYIGGGTPTSLSTSQLERLMQSVKESFSLTNDAEITIEANPCTVSYEKLCALRQAGVNRISFGVQSAVDNELKFLGRLHSFTTAKQAILNAKKAGFENISADIMLGLSGQSEFTLLASCDELCRLPLTHISAYMLKIEKDTPFDCEAVRRSVADDDTVSELYISLVKRLEENGFYHYEISNFSKPGYESRHNLKYWTGGEYIGFGPAAHSLFNGKRYYVERDLGSYISSPYQHEIPEDEPHSEREEYIMLALRLKKGMERQKLISLYGEKNAEKVFSLARAYQKNGLCVCEQDRIYLTPKGFLVSNAVIIEFLCCVGLA